MSRTGFQVHIDFISDATVYFCHNDNNIIANKKDVCVYFLHIKGKWKDQGVLFNFHTVSTSEIIKKLKIVNAKMPVEYDVIECLLR